MIQVGQIQTPVKRFRNDIHLQIHTEPAEFICSISASLVFRSLAAFASEGADVRKSTMRATPTRTSALILLTKNRMIQNSVANSHNAQRVIHADR